MKEALTFSGPLLLLVHFAGNVGFTVPGPSLLVSDFHPAATVAAAKRDSFLTVL